MMIRYLSAGLTGVFITAALIWVMQFLIAISEGAVTPPSNPPNLIIGRTVEDSPVLVDPVLPPPIPAPLDPPPYTPPTIIEHGDPGIPTTFSPQTPTRTGNEQVALGYLDSGLINIMHAEPEYPVKASQRGLEGHVIVQFDVTILGTVENVVVFETSSSIFNRAAVKAAYRSRYKPKTVDGVPQRTEGLRKLFTFQMDAEN